MDTDKHVESQAAKPAKPSSIWRTILIPVLCATVVTVFSLRFYNHRQLERLEAQNTKIKHIAKRVAPHEAYGAKSAGHDLHQNISGILQRHGALTKPGQDKDLPSWLQRGTSQGSTRKERKSGEPGKKVRREIRNFRDIKMGARGIFDSSTQSTPKTTALPGGTAPSSNPSFLGAFRPFRKHLSRDSPMPDNREIKSKTHSPSIANGVENPFINRAKIEDNRKKSFVNFSLGFKQPDKTDDVNETRSKTAGFSFSLEVQNLRDSDRDPRGSQINSQADSAGGISPQKLNNTESLENDQVTSSPVRNTTSQGDKTVAAEEVVWKSRQLKILNTSSEQLQKTPIASSIVTVNPIQHLQSQVPASAGHLQRAWDQSLQLISQKTQNPISVNHTSNQTVFKISKDVPSKLPAGSQNSAIKLSQSAAKQSIDIPLSQHLPTGKKQSLSSLLSKGLSGKQNFSSSFQNTTSRTQFVGGPVLNGSVTSKQPSDKLSNNEQAQTSQITHHQQGRKLVKTRTPPVNLQEIWDKSIRESDKAMNKEVKMSQRTYPGESKRIQEIWDDSIAQNLPSGNNEQELLQKPVQNGVAAIPQDALSSEKPKLPTKTVVDFPEVNLQSADMPPLSMRSKIMEFSFKPQLSKKYAVIGVAAIGTDYNYVFSIPLTVLSWQRIGCGCIVFLVGSEKYWVTNPILYFVLKELRRLDPVVLFLDAPQENWIFLSQVSRLFASNLFDWRGMESTLLITSDSDIWPLTKEMYDMPEDKKVISLNSDCCGSFQHQGQTYKMVPMCNIVMSVATWRDLMGAGPSGTYPTSVKEFIDYLKAEFGEVASGLVNKGENDGWFLDQHTVSVRLRQYELRHDKDLILYAPRDVGRDRVDRSHWFPYGITRTNDIHMLEHLYQPGTWERALPLLRQMYNETTNKNLEQYRDGFIRMLLNYKVSN